ncbi:hypothetical protein ACFC0M_21035 [Streptomyces sp. NPDC056149]|uniref:hypothetical protein n=1 Tax=unclassified Streptomyces TaxID=2593676 RepID=UPI002380D82F|nr:hypothetical protein [Streptomyces sp. WZ-12]
MSIQEILSRALLVRERTLPRDIVPLHALTKDPDTSSARTRAFDEAAEDLRALCETLVAHAPASSVTNFLTDQLPAPGSALILACILHLTDTDDGARFWWQYAAGAGHASAAYCLYLHHLAQGEQETAEWWHRQTDSVQPPPEAALHHPQRSGPEGPSDQRVTDPSTTTILRVLRHLARSTVRERTAAVTELMACVPNAVAVGYLRQPEVELPIPGGDFARQIRTVLDTAAHGPDAPDALPSRPAPHAQPTDPNQPLDRLPTDSAKTLRPPMGETATR